MASVRCVLTEDHLQCSICLEVFTDPVSTSCGHSFCKTCINQHWNRSKQYHCPICNEDFSVKPQLKTNTFMSEMVSQFRASPKEPEKTEEQTETGGVPCDVCSTPRLKALKSCLVCLASYCPTHLDPHLRTPRLQRHPLIRPVQNLEERICPEHDKPLDLLCQTEKMFICVLCSVSRHKDHVSVPLEEECERQQTELEELVKQRKQKIQEIQGSVMVNNQNADRELSEGVKVFSAMMESVQKSQDQFRERITADQKAVEDRAAEIIEQIEQEICVLQQREAGIKLAIKNEDHFRFIQTVSSENTALDLQDLTNTMVSPHAYEGLVDKALSELQKTLLLQIKQKSEEELKRVQQFEVDVTLDPDTAYPQLIVSVDKKQVQFNQLRMNYPDLPQRYERLCVLGKQKFSSGRSYFQVQVTGKTAWVVGVARESVKRKGDVIAKPENGYWTIRQSAPNEYIAYDSQHIPLQLKSRPETVGVFVDYPQGLVSFYNVDSAELLYSFTRCSFNDNLLTFLTPQSDDTALLRLTPVKIKNK